MIEVVANRKGFYKGIREPGESFQIESKEELGKWMDEVKSKPSKPEKSNAGKGE